MNLPGRCVVCRFDVVWRAGYWKERRGRDYIIHRCPEDRDFCGAWMPNARERCARYPGHRYEHRSAYALENAMTYKKQRCDPPDCVLPLGHRGNHRRRWFVNQRCNRSKGPRRLAETP